MEYYVYEHLTLNDDRFYIGKGKGYRYKNGTMRNQEWHNKTKHGFKYNVLMKGLTNEEANELELFIIKEIGYDNLCNKKRGNYIRTKRILDVMSKNAKQQPRTNGNRF